MINSGLILFSDLDGTLLTHDKHISEENMAAIKRLKAAGGELTVATGRSVESARKYVEAAGVTLPVVVYNGVVIYDYKSEKILWNDLLPEAARKYVEVISEKFPHIGIEVLRDDKIYVVKENEHVKEHIKIEMLESCVCALEEVPKGWFKVLMALDEEEIGALDDFIKQQSFENVYCVQSSRNYFEMLPFNSSKGSAMKKLCKILGFSAAKTAAIGDYNNDLEMIKLAKIGAAMQNAPAEVKAAADIVVDENMNNGFARFVDYILQ